MVPLLHQQKCIWIRIKPTYPNVFNHLLTIFVCESYYSKIEIPFTYSLEFYLLVLNLLCTFPHCKMTLHAGKVI